MPLWSLVIFGPLCAYTSSEVSGLLLQLQLLFCRDVVFPQSALSSCIILPHPHPPPCLAYFEILQL